jgi:hypothetical protein
MSKAKQPRKASKRAGSRKQPTVQPGDDFFEVLGQLVDAGHVMLATNDDGDDAVIVALPAELRATKIVDAETQRAEDRLLIADRILPARLEKLLQAEALTLWRGFSRFKLVPLIQSLTGRQAKSVMRYMESAAVEQAALPFVEQVVFQGFDFALTRYAEQIKHVPELAAWHRKRKTGGDLGRKTSSQRKEELAERIRAKHASMEKNGEPCTYQAVADALKAESVKCSRSTVDRAINRRTVKRKKR